MIRGPRRHHHVDDPGSQARARTRKLPGITMGGQEAATVSEDTASADPWRDLPVEDPGVRVIVTKRRLPAEREQVQPGMQHHAQECTGEWREFGQQPGTHLRLVRAGVARRELRTAEQQAVASLGIPGMLPGAASVGGKTFTWKAVPESPWLDITEFVRRSHQDRDREHFLVADALLQRISQEKVDTYRPDSGDCARLNLKELLDATGIPILYTSGTHFDLYAGARITFPDQRWLRFPVRGTERANAIMTAVDQAGNKVARYRITGKVRPFYADTMEITIHPSQPLTDELVLAIAVSADWLTSYLTPEGTEGTGYTELVYGVTNPGATG